MLIELGLNGRDWSVISKNEAILTGFSVYVIELALKLNPLPVSVQRKELADAEAIYQQVRQCLQKGQPQLLELSCEKVEDKKVTVLASEVIGVQLYEKTAATGGSKRPGFSFEA